MTNSQQKKFDKIINDEINGNISDAKNAIKKLTKLELLDLIEYYSGNYGKRHLIINFMRSALEA